MARGCDAAVASTPIRTSIKVVFTYNRLVTVSKGPIIKGSFLMQNSGPASKFYPMGYPESLQANIARLMWVPS